MLQKLHPDDPDRRADTDYLPARMLNEFVYCPRLFYLEHVDGLFAHNQYTLEGTARHKRVDKQPDPLPAADQAAEPTSLHARSVTLHSDEFGVIAKLDLIETEGPLATPVDYKRGSPRKMDDGTLGAWDPERVQLCVQALVLRENGYECDEGILFFWETRQRVKIPINDELIRLTRAAIHDAYATIEAQRTPPPLIDSPKCPGCSLVGICLPDETLQCSQSLPADASGASQRLLFDLGPHLAERLGMTSFANSNTSAPMRQLVTKRDEQKVLYLNTPGLYVGKSGEVLKIKEKKKVIQEVRLKDVAQVNLMGPIQVTTQAIQTLLSSETPLLYFSMGGWFYGMTQSVGLKNILWRREQFRQADNARFCLQLARQLVIGKIRNQRTLLMRNHIEPPSHVLRFMKAMIGEAARSDSIASLLGIEGAAARAYFEQFQGMIKVGSSESPSDDQPEDASNEMPHRQGSPLRFDFRKRNRRPPRDPINALLSLGYALLAKDLTVTCAAVGLDPYLGFYHQPRFGRPALALDMMEPFRPLIVDSAILSAVNQRMVTLKDFQSAGDAVALRPSGRKGFFHAYEQRMDQLVTHPLFGYRVSYRRVIEIQVRLLARLLMDEIQQYPVFVTR